MRIVVCDDHRLLLEALAHALATQGFTVEAATSHPAEAVAAVKLYDPDLLLIDLSFPEGNGLDAAREVIAQHPRTRVVVLTGSDDAAAALEAARIGVAGFIRKDQRLSAIVTALGRAAAGESWMDASHARRLRSAQVPCPAPRRPVDALTKQERTVLGMLQEGLSTAEIVEKMEIGNSTVRSHIQAILTKLGVHSRLQAVAMLRDDRPVEPHQAKG
jgi:two-component system, NarL family, nitrate/nitrite response regulator NarL